MIPLDPTVKGFSWPNARALCELCAAAYLPSPISQLPSPISHLISSDKTDTAALIQQFTVAGGTATVIAFRGSRNIADFIQDAKVFKSDGKCGSHREAVMWDANDSAMEVHSGVLEDVVSVIEEIIAVLRQLEEGSSQVRNSTPIFVTGHSKGGGEALLVALELARQKFNVAGVITFGGPRVFNATGAAIYDATLHDVTFRVVNQNDIVPRLPLAITGYRHCGQEIFLSVGGGWTLNPLPLQKFISDALGLYGAYRHKTDVLIADHILGGMNGYEKRIQLLE